MGGMAMSRSSILTGLASAALGLIVPRLALYALLVTVGEDIRNPDVLMGCGMAGVFCGGPVLAGLSALGLARRMRTRDRAMHPSARQEQTWAVGLTVAAAVLTFICAAIAAGLRLPL